MSGIGFVGLGDIGLPMASRLIDQVGAIAVWNRSAAKAAPLVARGASLAATPREIAARCELIGICVTSDDAVEEIVFGGEGLIAEGGASKLCIVNFSTGAPDRNADFARRAAAAGAGWVDAPVSGGVPAASDGTLTLFLGGTDEDIKTAAPLLNALSRHRTHLGSAGAGQAAKLFNQMIVASNILIIAETIAAARAKGIDVSRLPAALRGGFADSLPLQIFGPRMVAHQFTPRLGAVTLMLKDVKLAQTMTGECAAKTPMLDLTAEMLSSLPESAGLPLDADLAALVRLFEADGAAN